MQAKTPVLRLRDDGFEYFPMSWPLLARRPVTFLRWEDVEECRFVPGRMSGSLHIYARQSRRIPTNRGLLSRKPRPFARIPLSFLALSPQRLGHEMEDRASKSGVNLRWTHSGRRGLQDWQRPAVPLHRLSAPRRGSCSGRTLARAKFWGFGKAGPVLEMPEGCFYPVSRCALVGTRGSFPPSRSCIRTAPRLLRLGQEHPQQALALHVRVGAAMDRILRKIGVPPNAVVRLRESARPRRTR